MSPKTVEDCADIRHPIGVEDLLCSRFRTSKSHCTKCRDRCPVDGALVLSDAGVAVTAECIGCGACVSACPNGALQPRANTDRDWARRIAAETGATKGQAVSFGCARAASPADVVLPCLGRLTEPLLLEALAAGAPAVEVLEPDCSGCPLARAAAQKEEVLRVTSLLLSSLGTDRLVRRAVARADDSARATPAPEVGRRGFLGLLGAHTVSLAADCLPLPSAAKPPAEAYRKRIQVRSVNRKREHLVDVLRRLGPMRPTVVPHGSGPFADLSVDERCPDCNVCSMLCPVGALERREEHRRFTLTLRADLCTDCGVCRDACLPGAIHIQPTLDLSILSVCQPRILLQADLRACAACGDTFIGATDYCPRCRNQDQRRATVARMIGAPSHAD